MKKTIPEDKLAFLTMTVKKKDEMFADSVHAGMMPFNIDELIDCSESVQWDILESLAIEYLIEVGKLPTFTKQQDYERTGTSSYRKYDDLRSTALQLSQLNNTVSRVDIVLDAGVLDRIVIPTEFKQQIIESVAQLKHSATIFDEWGFGDIVKKGRGVNLLFSGTSGTGKTFCGELIAEYVGLPCELVSVASIESKWVGESEKNVQQLFKSLSAGRKVLILDEVDSFLSSRNSSDNQHYSKLTNQFLVELERHNGICVMTTNRPVKLDKALARRIDVVLDFPFPDKAARLAIWKKHIPAKAPIEGTIDYETLAELKLNGGQVKNAILKAARVAVLTTNKFTQELFMQAALREVASGDSLSQGKDHS